MFLLYVSVVLSSQFVFVVGVRVTRPQVVVFDLYLRDGFFDCVVLVVGLYGDVPVPRAFAQVVVVGCCESKRSSVKIGVVSFRQWYARLPWVAYGVRFHAPQFSVAIMSLLLFCRVAVRRHG